MIRAGTVTLVATLAAFAIQAQGQSTTSTQQGCKVVELPPGEKPPAGNSSMSSSVTAGGGQVSGSTTTGGSGSSATVHSGSGSGSTVTTGSSSDGKSTTTVMSSNGECTIYKQKN